MQKKKRRQLAAVLIRRSASSAQRALAGILLQVVGVDAALRFARGPRKHHLKSAAELRAYLQERGVNDPVRIRQSGKRNKPVFTVDYVELATVACIETYGENGFARLRPTHDPAAIREQLAFVLSHVANVRVAGMETAVAA